MSASTLAGALSTVTLADAEMLAVQVLASGGFTYSTATGYAPTDGYAVSVPNLESATTLALGLDYLSREIHRYAARHADTLAMDGLYLGAWHDVSTGTVYLDHTMVTPSASDAQRRAVQYQQAAFYNLATGEEIHVGADAARR